MARPLTPISPAERARRRLRWENRKRMLRGEDPIRDPKKAKKSAEKKERKRRSPNRRWSQKRRRVFLGDGRLKRVRDLKAQGRWLPREAYKAQREALALDKFLKWAEARTPSPTNVDHTSASTNTQKCSGAHHPPDDARVEQSRTPPRTEARGVIRASFAAGREAARREAALRSADNEHDLPT